jgi:hypothetical protein
MKKQFRTPSVNIYSGGLTRQYLDKRRSLLLTQFAEFENNELDITLDFFRYRSLIFNRRKPVDLPEVLYILKRENAVSPDPEVTKFIKDLKYFNRRGFHLLSDDFKREEDEDSVTYSGSFTLYRPTPAIRYHKGRSYVTIKIAKLPLVSLSTAKGGDQ